MLCYLLDLENIITSLTRAHIFNILTNNVFHVVSLMESLDSTLENKRPAAALNLLSEQKKPQLAIPSEGQYCILTVLMNLYLSPPSKQSAPMKGSHWKRQLFKICYGS